MKTCPKCGEQYSDNAEVCSSCGYVQPEIVVDEKVAKPAEENVQAAEPEKKKERLSASCRVGVIIDRIQKTAETRT